jgi:hypothetical protein
MLWNQSQSPIQKSNELIASAPPIPSEKTKATSVIEECESPSAITETQITVAHSQSQSSKIFQLQLKKSPQSLLIPLWHLPTS